MIFSSVSALCNSMAGASASGDLRALVPAAAKRDEWSEDGVLSLLEVYESKWLLCNRGKLKGTDWEDIAGHVSRRSSATKSFKTPSQCKNKIESLKKRYRSEAAGGRPCSGASSWQFFARMDGLLKGAAAAEKGSGIKLKSPAAEVEEVDGDRDKASNTSPENGDEKKRQVKRRKGLTESIRLLADSMLKMEQGRMEMWKEWEKIRVEMEVKKKEMEIKRTEIMAKTQLEIAELLVKSLLGRRNGL